MKRRYKLKKLIVTLVSISLVTMTACSSNQAKYGTPKVTLNYPDINSPVSQTPEFELQFSHAVTGTTTNTVTLYEGDSNGPQTPLIMTTNSSDRTIYVFDPIRPLDRYTNYVLLVSDRIQDDYGYHLNQTAFSFSTGDTMSPTVEMTSPLINESNVSQSINIQLQFSKPVYNVNQSTVYLQDINGNVLTLTNPTTTDNDQTYTFSIPINNNGGYLQPNTQYTLEALPYITDQTAYQRNLSLTEFTFTTGDTTKPTVVLLSPRNGQMNAQLSIDPSAVSGIINNANSLNTMNVNTTGSNMTNIAFMMKFSKPVANVVPDTINQIPGEQPSSQNNGTIHINYVPANNTGTQKYTNSRPLNVTNIVPVSPDSNGAADIYEVDTASQLPTNTVVAITATSGIYDTTTDQNPLKENTMTFQTGTIPQITVSVPGASNNNVTLKPDITLTADQAIANVNPVSVSIIPLNTGSEISPATSVPMWILGGPEAYQLYLMGSTPLTSNTPYLLQWTSDIESASSSISATAGQFTFTTGDYENPTWTTIIYDQTGQVWTDGTGMPARTDIPLTGSRIELAFYELGQKYPVAGVNQSGAVQLHVGAINGATIPLSVSSYPINSTASSIWEINPEVALSTKMAYYLTLNPSQIQDTSINNNPISDQDAFSFTSEAGTYVVNTEPINGSSYISPYDPASISNPYTTSTITLNFNKYVAIDTSKSDIVNLTGFNVSPAPATIKSPEGYTYTNTITIDPNEALAFNTLYSLDVFDDLAPQLLTLDGSVILPYWFRYTTLPQTQAIFETDTYSRKNSSGNTIQANIVCWVEQGQHLTITFSRPVTGLLGNQLNDYMGSNGWYSPNPGAISFQGPCGHHLAAIQPVQSDCVTAQSPTNTTQNNPVTYCSSYVLDTTHTYATYDGSLTNTRTWHTADGLCDYTQDNILSLTPSAITDPQGFPIAPSDETVGGNNIYEFDVMSGVGPCE